MKPTVISFWIAVTMLCASCCRDFPSRMPDIQLTDVYGNNVSAADLGADGRPVLLSFYATWCEPCANEIDGMARRCDVWREKYGAKVVVVSVDKYPSQVPIVIDTMKKNGWSALDVLFDADGELSKQLSLETIPTVYCIDAAGNIVDRTVGYNKRSIDSFERWLNKTSKQNRPE